MWYGFLFCSSVNVIWFERIRKHIKNRGTTSFTVSTKVNILNDFLVKITIMTETEYLKVFKIPYYLLLQFLLPIYKRLSKTTTLAFHSPKANIKFQYYAYHTNVLVIFVVLYWFCFLCKTTFLQNYQRVACLPALTSFVQHSVLIFSITSTQFLFSILSRSAFLFCAIIHALQVCVTIVTAKYYMS